MSSKPPKAAFLGAPYEPPALYPLYMTPHYDLQSAAAPPPPPAPPPSHSIFAGKRLHDAHYEAADGAQMGLSFAEKFKNWSFEPAARSTPSSDLHSYSSAVPLLRASNDHRLLCASAAAGHGGAIAADIKEGTDREIHANFVGSSVGEGVNVGILPLSSSDTFSEENYRSSTSRAQRCTAHTDMEILRANERHNAVSGSVHLFQNIPSSLTQQNTELSSASNYRLPYNCNLEQGTPFASSFSNRHHHSAQDFQLFSDHRHQWDPALHTSTGASNNPHAELLLLPGTSESVVEASHASVVPETGLSSSSKLDLLHVSSLHDKQGSAMALPLRVTGEAGPSLPPSILLWNTDKVDMAVGLGLQESPAERCTQLPLTDAEHHASMRLAAQSGLSLLLQSPLQRAHSTALALDAARYSARSGAGSLSVLRNSKYLKAAQQLLNESCNVCRDWNGRTAGRNSDLSKRSTIDMSYNSMQWSMGGRNNGCTAEEDVEDEQTSKLFSSIIGVQKSSHCLDLQHESCPKKEDLQKSIAVADNQPAAKQLPADERCHLQMRKARLVAMVEELDRRYQQYRDQMQLIVTSLESAAGMGGAAPYTTLARKAMSRQFRGLRDAIGEHIRAVCRALGEEVSSVPILSRGETPRLRLVDQRLRHQRSLQQMGLLQQQQAWRPQRGLPERAVSVLRAWLFEHFLQPYPKDSEKSMLARLTGLSRNQVSNWFINARVRLWKPMIEEMYIEERKALQEQGSEGIIGVEADEIGEQDEAANGGDPDGMNNMSSIQWMMAEAAEKQQATQSQLGCMVPLRGQVLDEQCCPNDLQSFVQFHSSVRGGAGPSPPSPDCQSHPFWWTMKLPAAAHVGDIGNIIGSGSSLLYNHSPHHQMSSDSQASALIQQQQQGPLLSSSASNLYKNGVSLTLGLQQPPLHSSFNPNPTSAANPYHERPSEALLF